MALTYSLAPNPKWYIADLVGRPLGGGYLATFSSLNHQLQKLVYETASAAFPWPYVDILNSTGTSIGKQGILFDENGSQGPFYFEFNSATPTNLYYLEVYDSDGVLQWTIDNFQGGSGGGGSSTEAVDLQNYVVNGIFWRNIGASANPIGTTFLKLAPGANTGLAETASNASPDICFIKTNATATDRIDFVPFGIDNNLLTTDVTPVDFLRYTCTVAGSNELQKCVQFPITSGVQNLSNQEMTITLWARATAGTMTLTLFWYQFFGDGASASIVAPAPITTLNLSAVWTKFVVTTTVPSVVGKTLGECHNDGLFLQVGFPLSPSTCTIEFTKVCLYLGDLSPDEDFETYDMINSVIDSPRTGDVRATINSFNSYGWVSMNDGTIGNPTSGATNRANFDTFPLFSFLWSINPAYAPMYDSTGVLIPVRGASAIVDFSASNRMSLTRSLGRVMGGAGSAGSGLTARALGEFAGAETHTISAAELPNHVHTGNGAAFVLNGGAGVYAAGGLGGTSNTTSNNGSPNNPMSILSPETFYNMIMKL